MNDRGVEPEYDETQATHWLSWVASGMQDHGRDLLLLEQLQPSWLRRRGQIWIYTIISRMIEGLVLGLTFELLFRAFFDIGGEKSDPLIGVRVLGGVIAGINVGILDCWRLSDSRFWAKVNKASMPLRLVISCAAVAIAVAVPVAILYRIMIMDSATTGALDRYQTPLNALFYFIDPATIDPVERIQAPLFALFYALLVGSRSTGRTLNRDVQSVETLGHSWGHAASGGIKGLVFGSIFGAFGGIIIFQGGDVDVSSMMAASAVMIGVLGGAIGAVFDGMQSSVRDVKNRPNEGIMLSVRNATVYALGLGVFCGLAFFVYCCVILNLKGKPYSSGIIPALWAGTMIMLITFIWFGGLEIIRHYTLRALLCSWGYTPWNYVRFLDYAAGKLVFLEKVGGGYKFIHRYLLEHFAELQTAAGNSPPGSSRKPADAPLLASRDDRPGHELPR